MAGQTLLLHGVVATTPRPESWKDRVAFWHRLLVDDPDPGAPAEPPTRSPHAGAFSEQWQERNEAPAWFDPRSEVDNVHDWGRYHTAQKGGSALGLGAVSPALDGRSVNRLRFSLFLQTRLRMPDEVYVGGDRIKTWEGASPAQAWHFLRFGESFMAVRLTAMVHGKRSEVRRANPHGYASITAHLLDDEPTVVDPDFRRWSEFGYVLELGSKEDSGSFEEFRESVSRCAWEYHHNYYRCSRYMGRHGELQIVDSVMGGTARFIAVDGQVETRPAFCATGLDPALVRLLPDGRRIVQKRTSFRPDYIGSPFYDRKGQVLETP
jgi:hypothetical protein